MVGNKMAEPDRTIDAQIAEMVGATMPWCAEGWSPSTDLNAAMRAYEEFRVNHQNAVALSADEQYPGWQVELLFDGTTEPICVYGNTLAMAICLELLEAAKR